jgi:hypothetical protein
MSWPAKGPKLSIAQAYYFLLELTESLDNLFEFYVSDLISLSSFFYA